MTIKKQFILLSSLLFLIPCFCVCFTLLHKYITSSNRMIIPGTQEQAKEISRLFSKEENKKIKKYFSDLPPDVDGVLLNQKSGESIFTVVASTIPEYIPGNAVLFENLWNIIQNKSDDYFYQFTSPKMDEDNLSILITRIPKHKHDANEKKRGSDFVSLLILFLFVIVFFILVIVIFISRNIFLSIQTLEKCTQDIANGNLDTKINLDLEYKKTNEITNIANSLEKMRLSLIEAQNRKIKLIMGISHDLRTPVAVIKGYTEGLKDGIITEPDEVNNALELIETKSNQLEGMIDSLINFTKMNTSEIRNSLIPNSITALIKDFAFECKNSADVFNRKLITDIQLKDDIIIPLDIQLAQRAFENLFSNALRYSRDNDTITISAIQQEKEILFSIADTGKGISEEDLPHIFDLFYRATPSRQEEGMGIGLSVVKNIIVIHNWKIEVESKLNEGTKFTITIPYKKS